MALSIAVFALAIFSWHIPWRKPMSAAVREDKEVTTEDFPRVHHYIKRGGNMVEELIDYYKRDLSFWKLLYVHKEFRGAKLTSF